MKLCEGNESTLGSTWIDTCEGFGEGERERDEAGEVRREGVDEWDGEDDVSWVFWVPEGEVRRECAGEGE